MADDEWMVGDVDLGSEFGQALRAAAGGGRGQAGLGPAQGVRLQYAWPEEVEYLQANDWARVSELERETLFAPRRLPGVEARVIADPAHPCVGQRGLFAARNFDPFDVIGEYVGRVLPVEQAPQRGAYSAALFARAAASPVLDASSAGNETRFVNDFRGVAARANCRFSEARIAGRPVLLVIATAAIQDGQEIVVDYGEAYWAA